MALGRAARPLNLLSGARTSWLGEPAHEHVREVIAGPRRERGPAFEAVCLLVVGEVLAVDLANLSKDGALVQRPVEDVDGEEPPVSHDRGLPEYDQFCIRRCPTYGAQHGE